SEADGAYALNGTQNFYATGWSTSATCDVTLSAWAKAATFGSNAVLMVVGDTGGNGVGGYSIFMNSVGNVNWQFGGALADFNQPSVPIYSSPARWRHVALTCKNTNQWTLYADGKPVGQATPTAQNPNGGVVAIGSGRSSV